MNRKLGLQMKTTFSKNRRNCFNLLWTLLLICIYGNVQRRYVADSNEIDLSKKKPLLGILLNIENISFPLIYGINMMYFLVREPSILLSLEWSNFTNVFPSVNYSKRIVFTAFVFDNITFFIFFGKHTIYDFILRGSQSMHWSEDLFLHYIVFFHPVIIFRIYQCYKIAIFRSLRQIESRKVTQVETILCRIKKLTDANKHLNEKLTLSLLLFLVNMSFDMLVTLVVTSSSSKSFTFFNILFVGHIAFNFSSIAYLNMKIDRSLEKIFTQKFKPTRQSYTVYNRKETSNVIRFQDIVIYKHYFNNRVFELFSLDMSFISALAIFVMNYWVLILQTQ